MKPEYKERWVAALRSGEYKQGDGYLKYGNNFCCLGVACEIFKEEVGLLGRWAENGGAWFYDETKDYLPPKMQELLGLNKEGQLPYPVIFEGFPAGTLASLNDHGATFAEIADIIEAQF